MAKLIMAVLTLLVMIPSSLLAMIYGWGIEPEHWGWIAQSYFFALIMPTIATFIPD